MAAASWLLGALPPLLLLLLPCMLLLLNARVLGSSLAGLVIRHAPAGHGSSCNNAGQLQSLLVLRHSVLLLLLLLLPVGHRCVSAAADGGATPAGREETHTQRCVVPHETQRLRWGACARVLQGGRWECTCRRGEQPLGDLTLGDLC
jgi:hypothetical protein